MTENFTQCFDHVLKWEGGERFHSVDGDPGGATKWGVSLRAYKRRYPTSTEETIRNLSYDEAAIFAFVEYWKPARCQDIESTAIALIIFDHTYNRGLLPTTNLIEEAFNPSIGIGHRRINFSYLNGIPERTAIRKLSEARRNQYQRLAEKVPRFNKFLKGWLNRVNDTEKVAMQWMRGTA